MNREDVVCPEDGTGECHHFSRIDYIAEKNVGERQNGMVLLKLSNAAFHQFACNGLIIIFQYFPLCNIRNQLIPTKI